MQAGDLRNRVTIKQKSVTREASGAEAIAWLVVATVWAAVEPLSGREFITMRQERAEISTRIRIRYMAGLTPSMRVYWGQRMYEIDTVIEIQERMREIHLMCREQLWTA